MDSRSRAAVRRHVHDELTVHHVSVLAVLRSGASADAAEIAAALDLDVDLVADLVDDDLEERGLVRSAS